MSAQILDGSRVAKEILSEIGTKITSIVANKQPVPKLVVIIVGNDLASQIYVSYKQKACATVGMQSELLQFSENIGEKKLLNVIEQLNDDVSVTGILVQMPLPKHIDSNKIIARIAISKDVDGFHPYNIGCLVQNNAKLRPCTPYGIMTLLKYYHVALQGMNAIVIGRSNIVGKPMALELINAGCTVTVCNSNTKNLSAKISQSDMVIAAVGKANIVQGSWIKPGAIVVDVGINRSDNGELQGDVEFQVAKQNAAKITPVPGGVGPLTVATLLTNTMQAYATMVEA